MQRIKKQHYVPQFYLHRFVSDKGKLYAFDKLQNKSYLTSVLNAASENSFYDIPEDLVPKGTTPQIVERALSQIEGNAAPVIKTLLNRIERRRKRWWRNMLPILSRREKRKLAFYIAIQIFRTKDFRELYGEIVEKGVKALVDAEMRREVPELSSEDYKVEFKPGGAAFEHGRMLFNEENWVRFTVLLNNHIWLIGINDSGRPLFTSDNPVVKHPHRKHPILSYNGYGSPGIEVAFPLTPGCILIMYERSHFRHIRRWDRKLTLLKDNVDFYNSLQVMHSSRHVYSPSDSFDLVERMRADYPHLFSEKRPRIRVD